MFWRHSIYCRVMFLSMLLIVLSGCAPDVRVRINRAADRGDTAYLLKKLKHDDEWDRKYAAYGLGRQTKNLHLIIPALIKALNDPYRSVGSFVVTWGSNPTYYWARGGSAIHTSYDSFPVRVAAQESLERLTGIRRPAGQNFPFREYWYPWWIENKKAIENGQWQHGEGRVNFFVAALKDHDKDVRAEAAEALGETKDPKAVVPLIAVLKNENSSDVRENAATALGMIRDARAVMPLIAALKYENNESAAEALGKIKDARAIKPLIAVLKNKYEYKFVRKMAAIALRAIKDTL